MWFGGNLRTAFFDMREGELGDREHGEDVAAEHAFDHVEVDFLKIHAHGLLGGVVDEDVDFAEPIY